MNAKGALGLFKESGNRWLDDRCYRMGAALAYYALFSIFPLVLIAVTAVGFVLGNGAETRARVLGFFDTSDPGVRTLLEQTLSDLQQHQTARGIGALVGVVTLLFGASAVFGELDTALNVIWRCPERKTNGIVETVKVAVKEKALSFALVLGAGALVLVSLGASTAITKLGDSASTVVALPWLWQLAEVGASVAFLTLLFAALFRIVPTCHVAWRDVLPAAFVTTLLFTLLKRVLAYYLAHMGSYAAYGAVGAILGMLTWIYLMSLLVFFGAELSRVYAEQFGSLRGKSAPSANDEGDDVKKSGGDPDRGAHAHPVAGRPVRS